MNRDPAQHTSICTFLNTYNGPTQTGSLVSPHKSLLPWAQSTANGYIVEFCPLDGTGILLIFTEQCELWGLVFFHTPQYFYFFSSPIIVVTGGGADQCGLQ